MPFSKARFLTSATTPDGYPRHRRVEVALAGRSNVGKSSLINTLTAKGLARVGKRPGRTQTINFYALSDTLCLVDLPGYGYAEVPERVRAAWGPMIERYLTGREQLRAMILLVDGRHGPTADDLHMLEWLKQWGRDFKIVATKWDKVKKSQRVKRMREMEVATNSTIIPFSAVTSEGKAALISYLLSLA
ncbi:MAG TPA: ribosome biogenesis GTP-binding protein YihA/YsxC [Limnochordia bacterium]|nr:ribosome biogenesis GTP-binding protein YihA/YsxC [Limnochordia bacterium]